MRRLDKHPLAAKDIKGIWRYTYENWGEVQADRYLRDLGATMLALCANPHTGKPRPDLYPDLYAKRVSRHIVFYRVNDETLFIVRVLHERMDPMSHL